MTYFRLSPYSLFSVKFLKDLYLIPCSIILYKTSSSLSDSLVSFQVIHVLLNSEEVWRFTIVKFNKAANISVPSPDRVSLWKFPLGDLWLLGKRFTEMNLLSNKNKKFIVIHNMTMVMIRPYKQWDFRKKPTEEISLKK